MATLSMLRDYRAGDDPAALTVIKSMRINAQNSRNDDDPDVGYAFRVLRFEIENPDLWRTLRGARKVDPWTDEHLLRTGAMASYMADLHGIPETSSDTFIAGCGHDIMKYRYGDVFKSRRGYGQMSAAEKAIIDGHAIDSAEVLKRCGYDRAARLVVTATLLNTRRDAGIRLEDVMPYEVDTVWHDAGQILEAADQALSMRELGLPHRPYADGPLSYEEIAENLSKQVRAKRDVIELTLRELPRFSPQ